MWYIVLMFVFAVVVAVIGLSMYRSARPAIKNPRRPIIIAVVAGITVAIVASVDGWLLALFGGLITFGGVLSMLARRSVLERDIHNRTQELFDSNPGMKDAFSKNPLLKKGVQHYERRRKD